MKKLVLCTTILALAGCSVLNSEPTNKVSEELKDLSLGEEAKKNAKNVKPENFIGEIKCAVDYGDLSTFAMYEILLTENGRFDNAGVIGDMEPHKRKVRHPEYGFIEKGKWRLENNTLIYDIVDRQMEYENHTEKYKNSKEGKDYEQKLFKVLPEKGKQATLKIIEYKEGLFLAVDNHQYRHYCTKRENGKR